MIGALRPQKYCITKKTFLPLTLPPPISGSTICFFALIMQSLLDYNCELYLVQCVFFLKAYVPGQMVQISYVTGEQKQSLTVKNA